MPVKRVVRFLGIFVVIYSLLLVRWSRLDDAYTRFFCTLGRTCFGHGVDAFDVKFLSTVPSPQHPFDTQITLVNRARLSVDGEGRAQILELDARGVGWIPSALVLSLILASPVSWRRKIIALLWGMSAVHIFILLSVGSYIWNQEAGLSLQSTSSLQRWILDGLENTFITQLSAGFAFPVLIWVVATFRRPDLEKLFRSAQPSERIKSEKCGV